MSSIAEKIRAILAQQLDVDEERIKETTDIAEELGADSLDVVELMMAVEEEFSLSIDEGAAKTFKTIGDVAKYIEEKR
ncbi:MAG: acyl carrier protein [Oscillospiraceae bacterium]|nr:acyl carrier protein [Oscillospiraceae bacterium]